MKTFSKTFVLSAGATALAVLLLTGCCQGSSDTNSKPPVKQAETSVDSTEREDSMKAFFERLRRWEVLHGGISSRKGEK